MDPVTLTALGLARFAPDIIKLMFGDDSKAAPVAQKLTQIAIDVTGAHNPQAAIDTLDSSLEYSNKFREALLQHQTELETLAAKNASDVNETMRSEATSEHWPTYSWRPAIGFAVALAVVLSVLSVFTAYAALMFFNKPEGVTALPGILAATAGILGIVTPILGIASWFRGKKQVEEAKP
jgi:hypothetical protein